MLVGSGTAFAEHSDLGFLALVARPLIAYLSAGTPERSVLRIRVLSHSVPLLQKTQPRAS